MDSTDYTIPERLAWYIHFDASNYITIGYLWKFIFNDITIGYLGKFIFSAEHLTK